MDADIVSIFMNTRQPVSLIEFLDSSTFDDLAEFDLLRDHHRNIFHVEGKYFVPLLDCSFHELYHYAQDHMVHPEDRETYRELMEPDTLLQRLADAEVPGVLHREIRYRLLDGSWRYTRQIVAGGAAAGLKDGIVRIYIYDIQNLKDRQAGRAAYYHPSGSRDELTGLPREKAFFSRAREKLEQNPQGWCLIAIDIENFKLFNDWYGREAGDLLLARTGALLGSASQRLGGLAGYMGQDDFSLLIPYDRPSIDRLYEDIHALVAERGVSMGFLPAVGVALADGSPVLDLFDRASLAAGKIKGDFHTRIRLYETAMREKTEEEYRLLSDFQRGLADGELSFWLQPQCRVSTGRIVGAESLARWRTPEGRMIPPDAFVPILEKYGFITDLDKFIWEEVCAWLRRWMDGGHTPLPISVNVSQIDIFTVDVPRYMRMLIDKYDLPANILKIEITESAYVDNTAAVRDAVQKLREMGFLVLMDDFGSGYSSLNMLRRLNVDVIKLDAQFLRLNEMDEEKGIHILESIINMTKTMSLPIIVEGVESEEQVSFLADLGCGYIQGYHFYRPMRVADFEKLISDEKNIDTQGISFKANQQFHVREFLDQNIYSDSMLNNILGAVAFYSWDGGENVDIVRFNEQFYHLVREPQFRDRLAGIQNFLHPNDVPVLFDILRRAEHDRLNGASGMMGVYRTDGSLGRFMLHCYYLEEVETGKVFYGAMQEVTEITTLQNQMRLLSRFSSESIVFLQRRNGRLRFQVVVHGLRDVWGLDQETFQSELNSGEFFRRIDRHAGGYLRRLSASRCADEELKTGFPFQLTTAGGESASAYLKTDRVEDEYGDVEYIVAFRAREEE